MKQTKHQHHIVIVSGLYGSYTDGPGGGPRRESTGSNSLGSSLADKKAKVTEGRDFFSLKDTNQLADDSFCYEDMP